MHALRRPVVRLGSDPLEATRLGIERSAPRQIESGVECEESGWLDEANLLAEVQCGQRDQAAAGDLAPQREVGHAGRGGGLAQAQQAARVGVKGAASHASRGTQGLQDSPTQKVQPRGSIAVRVTAGIPMSTTDSASAAPSGAS